MISSSIDVYSTVRTPPNPNAGGGSVAASNVTPKSTANVDVVKSVAKQAQEVDRAALTNAVRKLNELVAPALQSIQFAIDDETDRLVVRVVDAETKEVLRQIPNQEVLAFSKTLGRLQGLVVRESA